MLAMCLLAPISANALVIDGKTVEDLYGYILDILEEDKRVQEEYEVQALRNPTYRGYKPYTYSSLRHMTTEDLIYGAMQGAFAAVRQNQGEPQSVVEAQAEANIGLVMELFPMLARDFEVGEQLISRLSGSGSFDHFQMYLLRRAIPGTANPSLFSDFWQESIRRHRTAFDKVMVFLLEGRSTDPRALMLAMEITVREHEYRVARSLERDEGLRAWIQANQPGTSAAEITPDAAIMAAMTDPGPYLRALSNLDTFRKLLSKQIEPGMERPEYVQNAARKALDSFEQNYPLLGTVEQDGGPAPAPASAPDAPAQATEPDGKKQEPPRIGIPTFGL